jgi:heme a synthase
VLRDLLGMVGHAQNPRRLTSVAIVLITCQLVLGAFMRHDPARDPTSGAGAGLAIPDWPLHYGKVLPPMSKEQVDAVNQLRPYPPYELPPVTPGQVHLHFTHRLGAYLTFGHVIFVTIFVVRKLSHQPKVFYVGYTLGLLVTIQVALGITTVLMKKPADIATAHQATGALLLLTASVLLTRAVGLYAARKQAEAAVNEESRQPGEQRSFVASV